MRLLSRFVRRAENERELDEELRFYVDELAETNKRAGMPPGEALRAAKIQFGGIEQVKEHVRDARSGAWLESVCQDVRYAIRGLRNAPGFALVVVLSLAAGIGANSALFSVINAVMLRTLPLAHPEELFVLNVAGPAARSNELFSYPMFEQMRSLAQKNQGDMAAMSRIARMRVLADGERDQENGFVQLVSGEFFSVAELTPALGRFLTPGDNRIVGGHPVAVISDDFWQRRFGGSRTVLGRGMALNGSHFTIVGVAPPGFTGMWLESRADIWIPAMMQSAARYSQNFSSNDADTDKPWPPQDGIRWLNLVVRAHSNAGVLDAVFQPLIAREADQISNAERRRIFLQRRLTVLPMARGLSNLREQFAGPLFALMAMVGVVLLIACANTANLLLARARRRQREIAVRLSIGAGRARLLRQLLTESFLLAAIASAAGLALANVASEFLVRRTLGVTSGPSPFPTSVDARVLGFTILLSVVTTLLFGLAPAFRATGLKLDPALRAASRSIHGGTRFNLQKLLVVAQISLTLVLAVGAVWLADSLGNLAHLHLGYDPEHVVTVWISPQSAAYPYDKLQALYRRLVERAEALPGIRSAAVAACGLAIGCHNTSDVHIAGYQPNQGEQVRFEENYVGVNYFATVGMRLLAGRGFSDRDNGKSPRVALVNEAAARRYFPNGNAIGQRFGYGKADTEIIGIVENARVSSVQEDPLPMAYYSIQQGMIYGFSLEVRVAGDPAARVADIRRAVTQVDPELPIEHVTTLAAQVNDNLRKERLVLWLTSVLGALALGLGCFGLYGVMSYAVAGRTAELGIRMALGAPRSRLFGMVFGESAALIAAGLVAGLPFVFGAARLVSGMLFGVKVGDPAPVCLAMGALAAATAIVAYIPARRAARVQPMTALRYE
jgi:predicted permease